MGKRADVTGRAPAPAKGKVLTVKRERTVETQPHAGGTRANLVNSKKAAKAGAVED